MTASAAASAAPAPAAAPAAVAVAIPVSAEGSAAPVQLAQASPTVAQMPPAALPGTGATAPLPATAPVTPAANAQPAFGRVEVVPPPGPAEAETIQVHPGMRIVLRDSDFDPNHAKYLVIGKDLVIQTDDGGTVTLLDFFLQDGPPPTLSVLGNPPQPANILIASAVTEADQTVIMPAAAEGAVTVTTGGNASFAPYDPGNIGNGLDPLGPLGPTELTYGAPEVDTRTFDDRRQGNDGDGSAAPVLATTSGVETSIVDTSVGFTPGITPVLPISLDGSDEGRPLDEAKINGLDPRLVTLDAARDVTIVFQSEIALINSSLGAYVIGTDGKVTLSEVVFPVVNSFDTSQWFQDGKGPLHPGDAVSIGTVAAGSQLGLFFVRSGGDGTGPDLSTGKIEIRDPATGEIANFNTLTGPPSVYHIAPNGTATEVTKLVYFTTDDDPSTPSTNGFNPDGLAHAVSGWDANLGSVTVAFEDLAGPVGTSNVTAQTPGGARADHDYNDAVFQVVFGEADGGQAIFANGDNASLLATITDRDSTAMKAAVVAIQDGAKAGDILGIVGSADANHDGVIDGTLIAYSSASDTELRFSGEDSIAHYQFALDAVRYDNVSGDIAPGLRSVSATVTDDSGRTSAPAITEFRVIDSEVQLGPGNDTYVGSNLGEAIAGNDGHDTIFGVGGNDFLNGGNGIDELNGGSGNDTLLGMAGPDVLIGGPGADTFVYTALGDGRDEVLDFNLGDGDKFNLERLFANTAFDPNAADAGNWLQFQAVTADADAIANDLSVEVDLDGTGNLYHMTQIMIAYDVANIDQITIQSATTFGSQPAV